MWPWQSGFNALDCDSGYVGSIPTGHPISIRSAQAQLDVQRFLMPTVLGSTPRCATNFAEVRYEYDLVHV
jgi:hypothetical protein